MYICHFLQVKVVTGLPWLAWKAANGLHPHPAWFCLTLSPPLPHDGENFLVPSPSLGVLQSPAPPRKTLILIKLVSLIKIYLKLKINLSHQIKLIFSKNWIILLKCLTRQYHQKKKKKKPKQNKNLLIKNQ